MSIFWNAIKIYFSACFLLAIFMPLGNKEGYVMDVANSFGYYMGVSLRFVYDATLGIIV